MSKVIMQSSPLHPSTSVKPLSKRQQRQWDQALQRSCPECSVGVGQKCFNLAPSHRQAGVRYETKTPHKQRLVA